VEGKARVRHAPLLSASPAWSNVFPTAPQQISSPREKTMKLTGRHRNFIIAVVLGAIAAVVAYLFDGRYTLPVGVNIFFLVYMAGSIASSAKLSAEFLRKHVGDEDEPAPYILVVMLCGSRRGGPVVLYGAQQRPACRSATRAGYFLCRSGLVRGAYDVGVPLCARVLSQAGRRPGFSRWQGAQRRGVRLFRVCHRDDGTDLGYWRHVKHMRRLVLTQGVFSFFFNTVIVAAAVNVVVALAH